MDDKLEKGSQLLVQAIHFDETGQYNKAYTTYQEGLQIYMDYLKECPDEKKEILRGRILKLLTRAEIVKKKVEDAAKNEATEPIGSTREENTHNTNPFLNSNVVGPNNPFSSKESEKPAVNEGPVRSAYHEEIKIADNATGYSYEKIFGKCLQTEIYSVKVEEPYCRSYHQLINFLRFCELLVKSCKSLRKVILCTSTDQEKTDQIKFLSSLRDSLKDHGVDLEIRFSDTIHDRKISFSNGWIVKIGRGLNYFKARKTKHSIGAYDLDLAPCYESTVDIIFVEGLVIS